MYLTMSKKEPCTLSVHAVVSVYCLTLLLTSNANGQLYYDGLGFPTFQCYTCEATDGTATGNCGDPFSPTAVSLELCADTVQYWLSSTPPSCFTTLGYNSGIYTYTRGCTSTTLTPGCTTGPSGSGVWLCTTVCNTNECNSGPLLFPLSTTSTTTATATTLASSGGVNAGVIVGIVVGVVLFLILIIIGAILLYHYLYTKHQVRPATASRLIHSNPTSSRQDPHPHSYHGWFNHPAQQTFHQNSQRGQPVPPSGIPSPPYSVQDPNNTTGYVGEVPNHSGPGQHVCVMCHNSERTTQKIITCDHHICPHCHHELMQTEEPKCPMDLIAFRPNQRF